MCHNFKYFLSEAIDWIKNKVLLEAWQWYTFFVTKQIGEVKDNGVLHRKDNGFCSSETHSVHQTDLYAVDSPVRFFYPWLVSDMSHTYCRWTTMVFIEALTVHLKCAIVENPDSRNHFIYFFTHIVFCICRFRISYQLWIISLWPRTTITRILLVSLSKNLFLVICTCSI